MAGPPKGWLLNVLSPDASGEDTDDFRDVPVSDDGQFYNDRGMRGNFSSSRKPFPRPAEIKNFSGFGCTEEDYSRGYIEPSGRDDPEYDKINYQDRSTLPREPAEDHGNTQAMPDDWEFRRRNQRARGFLTRPRTPTER